MEAKKDGWREVRHGPVTWFGTLCLPAMGYVLNCHRDETVVAITYIYRQDRPNLHASDVRHVP